MTIRDFRRDGTGIQMQTAKLIPALRSRGVEVTIVSGRGVGQPRRESLDGTRVRRSPIPGPWAAASVAFSATAIRHIRRCHAEIDVLHTLGGGRHVAGAVAAATRRGVPALVKVSRAGAMQDLKMLMEAPFGQRRAARMIERAWFICQSSNVRAELTDMRIDPAGCSTHPTV